MNASCASYPSPCRDIASLSSSTSILVLDCFGRGLSMGMLPINIGREQCKVLVSVARRVLRNALKLQRLRQATS